VNTPIVEKRIENIVEKRIIGVVQARSADLTPMHHP
jgi:hypothetical protein